MKKISFLAAVCAAACCLAACDGSQSGGYEQLNQMLEADYSQLLITVTDTVDSALTLTSEYNLLYVGGAVMVSFSVERLAPVSMDAPASDMVETLTGEAVIQGGEIVSMEGDEIDLSAAIAERGMEFKEEYFENALFSDGTFRADVTDPAAFFGAAIGGDDAEVVALYSDVFNFISLSFVTEYGHAMEIRYTFTV